MDPNAVLERMRAAQHSLRTRQASDPNHHQAFSTIADCAEALDGWLSRGGFLPTDWQAGQDAAKDATRAAMAQMKH